MPRKVDFTVQLRMQTHVYLTPTSCFHFISYLALILSLGACLLFGEKKKCVCVLTFLIKKLLLIMSESYICRLWKCQTELAKLDYVFPIKNCLLF